MKWFSNFIDGCSIKTKSSGNVSLKYTVILPDGSELNNVGSTDPQYNFYIGEIVTLITADRYLRKVAILAPQQQLLVPISSLPELFIATYDDGDSEKIVVHNTKLEFLRGFTNPTLTESDLIIQDIAALKTPYYTGLAISELTETDYNNISISATSETSGNEVANLFDFNNSEKYWQSGEVGFPQSIDFDLSEMDLGFAGIFAVKIVRTNLSNQAKSFDIESSSDGIYYEAEVSENNYLNTYSEVWYYGGGYPYMRLNITASLDGSDSVSIQKIHLYTRENDYSTVRPSTECMVQHDAGMYSLQVYDGDTGQEAN